MEAFGWNRIYPRTGGQLIVNYSLDTSLLHIGFDEANTYLMKNKKKMVRKVCMQLKLTWYFKFRVWTIRIKQETAMMASLPYCPYTDQIGLVYLLSFTLVYWINYKHLHRINVLKIVYKLSGAA